MRAAVITRVAELVRDRDSAIDAPAIERAVDAAVLLYSSHVPAVTPPYVLTNSSSTLTPFGEEQVATIAAADVCGQLAAHYASEGDPTIQADSVDHQGKSGRWRDRQRDLTKAWQSALRSPSGLRPASAVTSFEVPNGY